MDLHNQDYLRKKIIELRIKKKMLNNVETLINEFKHFKQINKKFTEAFNTRFPDMHAWIGNEYTKKLHVRAGMWGDFVRIELGRCVEDFTWDNLLQDIGRYKIDEYIAEIEEKLRLYDEEYEKIKDFQQCVARLNLRNFHWEIRKIAQSIEDIIRYGKPKEVENE